MRTSAALLALALILTLAPGTAAGPLGDVTRVRPLNEGATALVAEAQQKSPTVRGLLKQLEKGDVVAYVQVVPATEGGPLSTLKFIGASHAVRFVLIQVASSCAKPCRQLELLGHELQQAVDVSQVAWVTSDDHLQRWLAATGWADASTGRGYETGSAKDAELKVRRDVRGITGTVQ
jgi:hypothetical protein